MMNRSSKNPDGEQLPVNETPQQRETRLQREEKIANILEDKTNKLEELRKLSIENTFAILYKGLENKHFLQDNHGLNVNNQRKAPSLAHICYEVLDGDLSEEIILYAIKYFKTYASNNPLLHTSYNNFKSNHLRNIDTRLQLLYYYRNDGQEARESFFDTIIYLMGGRDTLVAKYVTGEIIDMKEEQILKRLTNIPHIRSVEECMNIEEEEEEE